MSNQDIAAVHPALNQPLGSIRGVGPKMLPKLEKLGLKTVEDALYHLPLRYEDRRKLTPIANLRSGMQEVFSGRVLTVGETTTSRNRKRIYEVIVEDNSGQIALKWFRYRKPWLQKLLPVGQQVILIGEVRHFGGIREVHHPDVELLPDGVDPLQVLQKDPLNFGRILPVYPLTDGLTQKQIRKIWHPLVENNADFLTGYIPQDILDRLRFMPVAQAIKQVHWPDNETDLQAIKQGRDQARSSLVFDEFFFLELGLALKRAGVKLEQGIEFKLEHRYTLPLSKMLPFKLTDAQRRVLGEIKRDMCSPHPMHRLLQGDVGSGKTMVALMAALIAIENQTQVAIIAPTEILAEQHFQTFNTWLRQLDLKAVLLQGSMSPATKRETLQQIAAGEVNLVVGTHAVLQDGVEFQQLGLGIIDEQHRFGVKQRGVLKHKGKNPDMLVMTATPIPRTLSMTLYGDLSVSVIDQLPPGRKPVTTRKFSAKQQQNAYQLIRKEIEQGRQAYIVYPLVEESEKSDLKAAIDAAEQLKNEIFPQFQIGVLHGRMKSAEKDAVMTRFRQGELQLLVSTTVIEVGVDVPNATVMMIEHADRFGLSQLHQLRGRVGRGAEQSYCLLIPSDHYSDDAGKRLQVMVDTEDGFRIAEADLEIRGPGDFLGTRQAGLPDFRVASLLRDARLLEVARQEAFTYIEQSELLQTPAAQPIRKELLRRWGGRLELAAIG